MSESWDYGGGSVCKAQVCRPEALGGRVSRVVRHAEHVDKVELESVDVPLPQNALSGFNQIFAHLGKARVERRAVQIFHIVQIFPLGASVRFAGIADKRYPEPMHFQLADVSHMRVPIRKPEFGGFAVSPEIAAALAVVGIPSAVENNPHHSVLRGEFALLFEFAGEHVVAV